MTACGASTRPNESVEGGAEALDREGGRPGNADAALAGSLRDGATDFDAASGPCGSNEALCSGRCVDVAADPDHCGACGIVCTEGPCVGGRCMAGSVDAASADTGTSFDSGSGADPDADVADGSWLWLDSEAPGDSALNDSGGGIDDCSHSPCTTGAALIDGCDDTGDETVRYICDSVDGACCETAWTEACVEQAIAYCGSGSSDTCIDPGC